jgi:hypothetical protein
VVPPLHRKTPYWFNRYFAAVMTSFNEAFRHAEAGISVLPLFKELDYEKDGIHLTALTGPKWVFLVFSKINEGYFRLNI